MGNKGFRTKKSLGQNFLKDDMVINAIADATGCSPEDTAIEIGPGLGVLTEALSERAKKVVAVELDDRLIPILKARFALRNNVEIVHEDILRFDWDKVPVPENGALRIAGNLPYYITTPILLGILEKDVPASSITVMVQKEVADRIVAKPGGKDFGVLSVSLQYYAEAEKVLDVPAECFDPRPKVDSAVVVLRLKEKRALKNEEEAAFFRLVKQAFSQRRKTLSNSLTGYKGLQKEDIEKILLKNGVDPKRRAETLSVDEYIELSKEI